MLFAHNNIDASSWKDENMEYTAVLAKQSMLYNQFRYLCEMRDMFMGADELYDGGFDSTFFNANLFLVAAEEELKKPDTVGFGKKTAQPLWENTEFWRAILPKWFPGNDVVRFMRLIQALCIPRPLPFL